MATIIPAGPTASIVDPLTGDIPSNPPSQQDIPQAPDLVQQPEVQPAHPTLAEMAQQPEPVAAPPMMRDLITPTPDERATAEFNTQLDDHYLKAMSGELFAGDMVSQEGREMVQNDAALARFSGIGGDELPVKGPQREMLMRRVAMENYREEFKPSDNPLDTEKAFNKLVAKRYDNEQSFRQLVENTQEYALDMASRRAAGGSDGGIRGWMSSNKDLIGKLDDDQRSRLASIYADAEAMSHSLAVVPGLSNVFGAIMRDRSMRRNPMAQAQVSDQMAGGIVTKAAYEAYDQLKPEQRGAFIEGLGRAVKLMPPADKRLFLGSLADEVRNVGGQLIRQTVEGTTQIGLQLAETLPGGISTPAGTVVPTTPTETARQAQASDLRGKALNRMAFAADVRRIAESSDPLDMWWGNRSDWWAKTARFAENGILAAPDAVGTSVLAAIPYVGLPATLANVKSAAFDQYRGDLIDAGMDPMQATEAADTISLINAPFEAALEKLQAGILMKGVSGAIPKAEALTASYRKAVAASMAKHPVIGRALAMSASATAEAATETLQDIDQSVWRDAYDTFRETFAKEAESAIPDVDWGKVMSSIPESFITNFFAVGPMGIVGGMVESGQMDRREAANILREAASQYRSDTPAAEQAASETTTQAGLMPDVTPIAFGYQMKQGRTSMPGVEDATNLTIQQGANISAWLQGMSAEDVRNTTPFLSIVPQEGITPEQQAREHFDRSLAEEVANLSVADPHSVWEVTPSEDWEVVADGKPARTYGLTKQQAASAVREASTNGADTGLVTWITGWSETNSENGARRTLNRLVYGAHVLTAYHEFGHGIRNAAIGAGKLTREDEIRFIRQVDAHLGSDRRLGDLRLLPAKPDAQLTNEEVSEAFSQLMEAHAFGQTAEARARLRAALRYVKGRGTVHPVFSDVVSQHRGQNILNNIKSAIAMVHNRAGQSGSRVVAVLNAIRANFGLAMARARRIRHAVQNGQISKDMIPEYIARVTEDAQEGRLSKGKVPSAKEFSKTMSALLDGGKTSYQELSDQLEMMREYAHGISYAAASMRDQMASPEDVAAAESIIETSLDGIDNWHNNGANVMSKRDILSAVSNTEGHFEQVDVLVNHLLQAIRTLMLGRVSGQILNIDNRIDSQIPLYRFDALANARGALNSIIGQRLEDIGWVNMANGSDGRNIIRRFMDLDGGNAEEAASVSAAAMERKQDADRHIESLHRLESELRNTLASDTASTPEQRQQLEREIAMAEASVPVVQQLSDMMELIGAMATANREALVSNQVSVLRAIQNSRIAGRTGLDITAFRRMLEAAGPAKANLAANAGAYDPAEQARLAECSADSGIGGKLTRLKHGISSLRSFAGTMRRAFGYKSDTAEQIITEVIKRESAESIEKNGIYTELNDALSAIANGRDPKNPSVKTSGKGYGLAGKGYDVERLIMELDDVSNKKGKERGVQVTIRSPRNNWLPRTWRLSHMQALHAMMMWSQEDGRSHMQHHGWNAEVIDSIREQIDPRALEIGRVLREQYDTLYHSLNEVYRSRTGFDMPRVVNYSPITVKPDIELDVKELDPVTGASLVHKAGFTPGSLTTRVQNGNSEPDVSKSALQVFKAHLEQVMHWKHFSNISELMYGTLSSREVQDSVSSNAGKDVASQLQTWADFYYTRGTQNAARQLAYTKLVHKAIRALQGGILIGRIGTLMIQSMNVWMPTLSIGFRDFLKGCAHWAAADHGWSEAYESDFIQQRVKDGDVFIQDLKLGGQSRRIGFMGRITGDFMGRLNHLARTRGSDLIVWTDGKASTMAYTITYHSMLAKGMSKQQAHDEATRILDQVLQPTRDSQKSLFELESVPMIKSVWAFASEPRQKLAYLLDHVALNQEKGSGKWYRSILWGWLAAGLLQGAIRAAWRDARDDEDDELFDSKNWGWVKPLSEDFDWKTLLVTTTLWPLDGMPVLGDTLQAAADFALGRPTFGQDGMLASTLVGSVKTGAKAVNVVRNDEMDDTTAEQWIDMFEKITAGAPILGETGTTLASASHLVRDVYKFLDTMFDIDEN